MSDVLAFQGVSVVRGKTRLLDDISWEVEEGERWIRDTSLRLVSLPPVEASDWERLSAERGDPLHLVADQ